MDYCLRLFADWRWIHFEQNQFKYRIFPYVIASSVIFHYFVKFHYYKWKGNAPPGIQDVKVFYMPSMLLIDIPHKLTMQRLILPNYIDISNLIVTKIDIRVTH